MTLSVRSRAGPQRLTARSRGSPRPRSDTHRDRDWVGTHGIPRCGRGRTPELGSETPLEDWTGPRDRATRSRVETRVRTGVTESYPAAASGQFEPAPDGLGASPTHSPFQPLSAHSGRPPRGPAAQQLRQVRTTATGHLKPPEVVATEHQVG